MATDEPPWEERLVRPIDTWQVDDRTFRLEQWFVRIEADDGSHGIAGPVWPDAARLVLTQLVPIIIGKDPQLAPAGLTSAAPRTR